MCLKFQNKKLLNKFWLLNLSLWRKLNEKCSRVIVFLRTKMRWSVGNKFVVIDVIGEVKESMLGCIIPLMKQPVFM